MIRATDGETGIVVAVQCTGQLEAAQEIAGMAETAGSSATLDGSSPVVDGTKLQNGDWLARATLPGAIPTGPAFVIPAAEFAAKWRELGG